ncbi:MAG: alpha-glucan family phosphorylase [Chloroflexi bacterium]|nr:alpha-glucan family phosphorylase [Chloroflexota bacterium]
MTIAKLPERIVRLDELAHNLWWSWNEEARRLFRALDYPLWRITMHNPAQQLRRVSFDTLQAAATDPAFLKLYDSVMSTFDTEMSSSTNWVNTNYQSLLRSPIAYFSMEFAIHNSLPIYAGGLGILAGDICKESSELGLPMVAVGFMYPQGYFHQNIAPNGWQEEVYRRLDFDDAPIKQVLSPAGSKVVVNLQIGDFALAIGVWQVLVGRTTVYLLDTNLEQNPQSHRQLWSRLYIADRESRLQQEIILGIGGVRVLRALNINPAVWHANEGHTAFMMLERLREEVTKGASFAEALGRVQATTVFTTHTPVMAGHDVFTAELMVKYFSDFWKSLGIEREAFLQLGSQDGSPTQTFNMTAAALRMANQRCGVSQLHGKVTRQMWHSLWPEIPEDRVPISSITNGIHVPSWVAPELYHLFEGYLAKDWIKEHDDPQLWQRLDDISDEELWSVRRLLKLKLIAMLLEHNQDHWAHGRVTAEQVLTMGALLDDNALTIGFVRRFTEYKRPLLIFRDIERLKKIVKNLWYPVQIIFAGKSHPTDAQSKRLLQQVYSLAGDRDFQGRIVFVEDYDMHIARYLVQGVDVWLNTPRRRQEACGTSGMKASLNGVLHLSVPDGWWLEGYNGNNGWSIGGDLEPLNPEEEDEVDAESLYRLLEEEVVPLYYRRDRRGVPEGWIRLVREAIRSIVPVFCARRMLKEYTERLYQPAAQSSPVIDRR